MNSLVTGAKDLKNFTAKIKFKMGSGKKFPAQIYVAQLPLNRLEEADRNLNKVLKMWLTCASGKLNVMHSIRNLCFMV